MADNHPGGQQLPPGLSPRRPRRGRAARLVAWVASALSLVILATSGALYVLYRHYDSNITRLPSVIQARPPSEPSTKAMNILVVGSDTRNDLSDEDLSEIGTTRDGGGVNTDTIILLHLDPDVSKVTMVSIPRDSYINVPGWANGRHKINSVYSHGVALDNGQAAGGARLLTQTIEQLSGLHIDHYVQIDFKGFIDLTDAVGGVDVCLKKAQKDHYSGIDLPAGVTQDLKGPQALAFVRQRHGLPAGDLDRIQRQQYFAGALLRKVTSTGVLLNPLKLNAVLNAATNALSVDEGLSTSDMRTLALKLRHLDSDHLTFATVPVTNANAVGDGGQSVVLLDEAALPSFFQQLEGSGENSSPGPSASADAQPLTVPASAIAVQVQNGARKTGLARQVSGQLSDLGFQVTGYGNASSTTDTYIKYGPSKADSARTLQAAVPGAVLRPDASAGQTLTLVLGSTFTKVQSPTATEAPSTDTTPSPTPSSTPSPTDEIGGIPCIN